MSAILAPAALFPGARIRPIQRIGNIDVQADAVRLDCSLTMTAARPGNVFHNVRALARAPDLQLNMRLIARFVVLMIAVFGVSLAFAWAWDKSDKPQDAAAHTPA
jgi:hypothetical protein